MSHINFYNKLVRDNIPNIIKANGHKCTTTIASDATYLDLLDMKLCEEVTEYQMDKSPEELADILEVMMAIAVARGYTWDEIIRLQKEKHEARGGFENKIILISTEE